MKQTAMMRCPCCNNLFALVATIPSDQCEGCAAGLSLYAEVFAGGTRHYHMTDHGVAVPHKE